MPFVSSTPRLFAALIITIFMTTTAASASGDDEQHYATLLRTINPHLQIHQSQAYARSLVADAERANLDPRLIVALVTIESHWRPNAISPVGARGLGQLMPGTAAGLRVNAWDPTQNIRGAATYLRAMLDHFAGRGTKTLPYAIGAYNAGPRAVDHYHGIPPYVETQNYVRKVLAMWRKIKVHFGDAFTDSGQPVPATADGALWLANTGASALPVSDTDAAAAAALAAATTAVSAPVPVPVNQPPSP